MTLSLPEVTCSSSGRKNSLTHGVVPGGVTPRPIVRMDQLWQLAVTWYSTRLEAESRRPAPNEMRSIFEDLGLAGDFWDPTTDMFG